MGFFQKLKDKFTGGNKSVDLNENLESTIQSNVPAEEVKAPEAEQPAMQVASQEVVSSTPIEPIIEDVAEELITETIDEGLIAELDEDYVPIPAPLDVEKIVEELIPDADTLIEEIEKSPEIKEDNINDIVEIPVEPEVEQIATPQPEPEPIQIPATEVVEEEVVEEKTKEKKSFFSKTTNFFASAAQKVSDSVKSALGVEKIKEGLTKTRRAFSDNLKKILSSGRKIDDGLLDEIEELLITADIGVDTTEQIIESLRQRVKKENWENAEDLYKLLQDEILKIMVESPSAQNDKLYELPDDKPYVILVIGVNGVGKTTTIGKLAHNYKNNGYDVMIGAADTFRAAANEQLEIWAERAGVDIVQQQQGADPAAVTFDTLKSAVAKQKDVVIIDTAGRLHNKKPLMDELEKINRVMKKIKPDAPNEVFLILDATTGQNATFQAKEFSRVTPLTGIVLTKLDGTAKGGVVISIANELKVPVRYIGVGEKIDDLQPFDAKAFVAGLFEDKNDDEEIVETAS
jgi:fused signal recognition particle receptor